MRAPSFHARSVCPLLSSNVADLARPPLHAVKRHLSFFRCARELGETYARKDQRVVFYLVTDSAHLKQDAQRVLGNKLVTTNMVPQHVHQKSGHVDGVMNAVVEDWILAKADMLVATQVRLSPCRSAPWLLAFSGADSLSHPLQDSGFVRSLSSRRCFRVQLTMPLRGAHPHRASSRLS